MIWGDPHSVDNYYVLLCRHPSLQIPAIGLKPSLPPCFRESSHGDGGILNPVISQPSTHWSITKKQEPAHLSQGDCRVTRSTFHQHAAQPVCTGSKLTGLYIDRTASFPKGKGHAPLPTTPLENRANSVRSTHCKCQHPGKETQTRTGILQ